MSLPARGRFELRPVGDGGVEAVAPDGTRVALREGLDYFVDAGSGTDLLRALGLPCELAALERLAVPRGLSNRWFSCVIADESMTRLSYAFHPQYWEYEPSCGQPVTLGHVSTLALGHVAQLFLTPLPVEGATGATLVGYCQLFDSVLSDRVWGGIRRGVLRWVSPTVVHPDGRRDGPAFFAEASLTESPASPGARILKTWTA